MLALLIVQGSTASLVEADIAFSFEGGRGMDGFRSAV